MYLLRYDIYKLKFVACSKIILSKHGIYSGCQGCSPGILDSVDGFVSS